MSQYHPIVLATPSATPGNGTTDSQPSSGLLTVLILNSVIATFILVVFSYALPKKFRIWVGEYTRKKNASQTSANPLVPGSPVLGNAGVESYSMNQPETENSVIAAINERLTAKLKGFKWMWYTLTGVSDRDVHRECGDQALSYLTFLKGVLLYTFASLFLSLTVALPVNLTGNGAVNYTKNNGTHLDNLWSLSDFAKTTIANVLNEPDKIWAHVAMIYVTTAVYMCLLIGLSGALLRNALRFSPRGQRGDHVHDYKAATVASSGESEQESEEERHRRHRMSIRTMRVQYRMNVARIKKEVSRRTVLVQNLPRTLTDETYIKQLFEAEFGPNTVFNVSVALDHRSYIKLLLRRGRVEQLYDHDQALLAYWKEYIDSHSDRLKDSCCGCGYSSCVEWFCCPTPVFFSRKCFSSLEERAQTHKRELGEARGRLASLRKRHVDDPRSVGVCFVTFYDPEMVHTCVRRFQELFTIRIPVASNSEMIRAVSRTTKRVGKKIVRTVKKSPNFDHHPVGSEVVTVHDDSAEGHHDDVVEIEEVEVDGGEMHTDPTLWTHDDVRRREELQRYDVARAPAPDDVLWEHLGVSGSSRFVRSLFSNALLFLLVFFLSSPLAIVETAETFFKQTSISHDIEHDLNDIPALSFLLQYLPTFLLFLVKVMLPKLVFISALFERPVNAAELQYTATKRYYIYAILAFLFLPSLAQVSVNIAINIFKSDKGFTHAFKNVFLPNQGAFFLAYLMQLAFLGLSFSLLRIDDRFIDYFHKQKQERFFRIKLPSKDKEVASPTPSTATATGDIVSPSPCSGADALDKIPDQPEFDYPKEYVNTAMVLSIVQVYGTFTPFIVLFGCFYFLYKYVVDKFNILFVHQVPLPEEDWADRSEVLADNDCEEAQNGTGSPAEEKDYVPIRVRKRRHLASYYCDPRLLKLVYGFIVSILGLYFFFIIAFFYANDLKYHLYALIPLVVISFLYVCYLIWTNKLYTDYYSAPGYLFPEVAEQQGLKIGVLGRIKLGWKYRRVPHVDRTYSDKSMIGHEADPGAVLLSSQHKRCYAQRM